MTAPGWVDPVLRFICKAPGSFAVGSLPGDLDAESKLVLARRLIKEGFLRVVEE